jgi:hypothetical protein
MIMQPRLSMPAAAGQPARDRARRRGHGSPAGYAGKRGACEVRSSARTVPSSQRSRVPGSLPRRKDLVSQRAGVASPAARAPPSACWPTLIPRLAWRSRAASAARTAPAGSRPSAWRPGWPTSGYCGRADPAVLRPCLAAPHCAREAPPACSPRDVTATGSGP